MPPFLFPPMPPVALPVLGQDLAIPLRRVFCVGRNYADHAREMGADPGRQPPVFFTKPVDAVVPGDGDRPYPPATDDLHPEVELVVVLGDAAETAGRDLDPDAALSLVAGYAVGLDMTRRDLQAHAKRAGEPWDMAKGFDQSALVGPVTLATALPGRDGPPHRGTITLTVNGAARQAGDLADMIWPLADILAHLSRLVTLRPGDLVFTGTPAGVGPVRPGDTLRAEAEGLAPLTLRITPRSP
ncbi:fumarylacetoacetate hydrolase family protein [Roseospira visakhapatnamensis]|uniref:Fumarylpyruvate hydrolase n=1 Tax=Roseospira visakhapatnamensis TaxID=390880 RepID=A0A7W6RD78_9PROT|nr:fumarylacetoacetate hydrolase family protein [Roseospira visakhapatnamensis]MBB4266160.1 fumarylpyruvate hydrolase [Roseospira visakhapatnamensis]